MDLKFKIIHCHPELVHPELNRRVHPEIYEGIQDLLDSRLDRE